MPFSRPGTLLARSSEATFRACALAGYFLDRISASLGSADQLTLLLMLSVHGWCGDE